MKIKVTYTIDFKDREDERSVKENIIPILQSSDDIKSIMPITTESVSRDIEIFLD